MFCGGEGFVGTSELFTVLGNSEGADVGCVIGITPGTSEKYQSIMHNSNNYYYQIQ